MDSVYAIRVQSYGRRWQRPWLVLFGFLVVPCALFWLCRTIAVAPCEPMPESRYRPAVNVGGVMWTADLQSALRCASKRGRRILIGFHAVTDKNAALNERHIFRDERVKAELADYVPLLLYIDMVPEYFYREAPKREQQEKDADNNRNFEKQEFNTEQEPLYAIVEPTPNGRIRIVDIYELGRIDDVDGFIEFLRKPRPPKPWWRFW